MDAVCKLPVVKNRRIVQAGRLYAKNRRAGGFSFLYRHNRCAIRAVSGQVGDRQRRHIRAEICAVEAPGAKRVVQGGARGTVVRRVIVYLRRCDDGDAKFIQRCGHRFALRLRRQRVQQVHGKTE